MLRACAFYPPEMMICPNCLNCGCSGCLCAYFLLEPCVLTFYSPEMMMPELLLGGGDARVGSGQMRVL